MGQFIPGWYVIYTRPRHEQKVSKELEEKGIDYYLPTQKVFRIWHDRKKYVNTPLFQSYVFVNLKDQKDYYEGLSIQGALWYVRFGKETAKVNDSVIENIKLTMAYGQNVEVTEEQFRPGQQLHVVQGPFAGLSCEIIQAGNRKKILIRVNLLKRNLVMEMLPEQLCVV